MTYHDNEPSNVEATKEKSSRRRGIAKDCAEQAADFTADSASAIHGGRPQSAKISENTTSRKSRQKPGSREGGAKNCADHRRRATSCEQPATDRHPRKFYRSELRKESRHGCRTTRHRRRHIRTTSHRKPWRKKIVQCDGGPSTATPGPGGLTVSALPEARGGLHWRCASCGTRAGLRLGVWRPHERDAVDAVGRAPSPRMRNRIGGGQADRCTAPTSECGDAQVNAVLPEPVVFRLGHMGIISAAPRTHKGGCSAETSISTVVTRADSGVRLEAWKVDRSRGMRLINMRWRRPREHTIEGARRNADCRIRRRRADLVHLADEVSNHRLV
ncbi:hypothetical protein PLICRDRAFT_122262 [Plicaturopsis crispa FD-325 SS-3]|nr:hypothetical protein PLICRDRAFT_122262 [Plicaturopsis crispa FD-325 SS-3]